MRWTRKRIAETPLCTVVINVHINAHVWAMNAIPNGMFKNVSGTKVYWTESLCSSREVNLT